MEESDIYHSLRQKVEKRKQEKTQKELEEINKEISTKYYETYKDTRQKMFSSKSFLSSEELDSLAKITHEMFARKFLSIEKPNITKKENRDVILKTGLPISVAAISLVSTSLVLSSMSKIDTITADSLSVLGAIIALIGVGVSMNNLVNPKVSKESLKTDAYYKYLDEIPYKLARECEKKYLKENNLNKNRKIKTIKKVENKSEQQMQVQERQM